MSDIQLATPDDGGWIRQVWEEKRLGAFALTWYRYWHGSPPNEYWWVIQGRAFAHFRVNRRTGVCNLYEIAVAADARRQGYGKRLIQAIGLPIRLKTDADNQDSNAFYLALGIQPRREGRW
jgi:GNAT superfamily N-acetyltransferase